MVSRRWVNGSFYSVAVIIALGLIGWLNWQPSTPAAVEGIRVVHSTAKVIPASIAGTPDRALAASPDWLLGTWSRRDNKQMRGAPCDLSTVITYLPNGQYFSPQGSGHYALGAGSVTYWGKIIYDIDAGEDRSHFDDRSTAPLASIRDDVMESDGVTLYRCDKTAIEAEPAQVRQ